MTRSTAESTSDPPFYSDKLLVTEHLTFLELAALLVST